MTYNEFIQNIIDTRGQWNIPEGEYYEAHHIIPRCMGGLPKSTAKRKKRREHPNIIWLYPDEHYKAHELLALENLDNMNLICAWNLMSKNNTVLPEVYKILRERFSVLQSNRIKGKKLSEESKNKLSQSRKEKYKNEPFPLTGRHLSEETKKKISKAHQFTSEETREKLRELNLGEKNPMFGKPSTRRKKVICVETGVVYNSIDEATKITGISNIGRSCKYEHMTSGGYHWRFYYGNEGKKF